MARIRTIKPEFFSHEGLASKSAHARLLAIGLLTLADCKGRLRWVPMQVHAQVFPWEAPGEAFENVDALLDELVGVGYVVHYRSEGKRFVQIVNFTKHQRLSGKESSYESRIPAPPENYQNTIDFPANSGEGKEKQLDASQGSDGNPLGTGEHRNIGTGEHRNIGTEEDKEKTPAKKPKALRKLKAETTGQWEVPPHLDTPEVRELLVRFEAVRRQKNKPITDRADQSRVFKHFDDVAHLTFALETCIANGYQGLKPDYRPASSSGSLRTAPVTFAQQRLINSANAMKEFGEMINEFGA